MDELRFNKVFAGFLFAGLLILAGIQIANVLVPEQQLAKNAYVIELPEANDLAVAAPQDIGPEPILALLASADVMAGEKLAKKCTACHVFEVGGVNKVGPSLWGVVNKTKASVIGYNYSSALTEFGGTWDYPALNAFLAKPKAYISGTKMNFAGLKKPEDRANIVAWLRTMADSEAPLPTPQEIAEESDS